ncbi:unnamed protein product [Calypogeia fissa]
MASVFGSTLKRWLAYHPKVLAFRWQRGENQAASYHFMISSVLAYLFLVYVFHSLMKLKKRPMPLGPVPVLHNLVLALGSLVMFAGCLQSTLVEIQESRWLWGPKSGRLLLLCFPPGTRPVGRVFFWSYMYYLSKYYELVDTFILILKKRQLTFLHVFHHATVIFMSFFWLEFAMSLQIVALLTNSGVHVVMYTYYFLCSIGKPPPWKKLVTNSQIVQFIFSFVASIGTLWFHFTTGEGCAGMGAWVFNAVFNVILLALFLSFHRKQYGKRKAAGGKGKDSTKEE